MRWAEHKAFGTGPSFSALAAEHGPPSYAGTFDDREPPMLKYWPKIKKGDVVVDIGAGFGAYTMPALAMGAHVLAFEPSDDGFRLLCLNTQDWQPHCTVSRTALFDGGDYPPELREVFTKHYPASHMHVSKLDNEVFGKVDWIKIDVEGAELGVLQGAMKTLETFRPSLIIEIHDGVSDDPNDVVSRYPESIGSANKILSLLAGLEYTVEVMRWDVSRRFFCAEYRP